MDPSGAAAHDDEARALGQCGQLSAQWGSALAARSRRQGTLYRTFPTREHQPAEVYRQEIDDLVSAVPALQAERTPLDALARWLDRLIEYARVNRGLMAAIETSAGQDLHAGNRSKLDAAPTAPLSRGQTEGEIREGVDAADVILLLGALSRVPPTEGEARARTMVTIIIDGLRRR